MDFLLLISAEFDVTLAKKKDGYKCDIKVVNVGSFIRGEARADRIEPVVDMAVDDLKRKLRKLKTFLVDKKRNDIDKLKTLFFGKDLRVSEGEPYKEVRKYDFSSYYPEEKRYNSNRQ